MVKVAPIEPSMFEQIYDLLYKMNPRITQEEWSRILSYHWENHGEYQGLVLLDEDKVVGYIGCLFSERLINGRQEKILNTSSWIVEEAYRAHSLSLLLPLMKFKDHTITNLSPSKETYSIFTKLGYRELESQAVFLPFLPTIQWLASLRRNRFISDMDEIKKILNEADRRILEDHLCYKNCQFFVIKSPTDYCFLITRIPTKGRWFWFTQIYYISNHRLFWELIDFIKWHLLRLNKTWMTFIEQRFVDFGKAGKLFYTVPLTRLFKSSTCEKEEIDLLYSEQILLNR